MGQAYRLPRVELEWIGLSLEVARVILWYLTNLEWIGLSLEVARVKPHPPPSQQP
jgi:hypothetical protein